MILEQAFLGGRTTFVQTGCLDAIFFFKSLLLLIGIFVYCQPENFLKKDYATGVDKKQHNYTLNKHSYHVSEANQ